MQLQTSLRNISDLNKNFQDLFEVGFTAVASNRTVLPDEWINEIGINPVRARIITKLYPNEFGFIELATIDMAVSKVITLMAGLNQELVVVTTIPRPPKTPEQRAQEAARRTEIGAKGENFVLEKEREKINIYSTRKMDYPIHQSIISDEFGYDILSHDEEGNDIYIEVKTTTRSNQDPLSRQFFISENEKYFYSNNIGKYRLIRVCGIEDIPSMEEVVLSEATFSTISYKVNY